MSAKALKRLQWVIVSLSAVIMSLLGDGVSFIIGFGVAIVVNILYLIEEQTRREENNEVPNLGRTDRNR